jgi:hypothetical protein
MKITKIIPIYKAKEKNSGQIPITAFNNVQNIREGSPFEIL